MSSPDRQPPPPSMIWLRALREPHLALNWPLPEWERLVRLARRLRLLARLAESLMAAGLIDQVPPQARRHLIAEQRLSRWRSAAMVWAIERVNTMLGDATYPRVLLKGAAYVGQNLSIAAGRLPSDLDILVPLAHLEDAQARLVTAGWSVQDLDEHDQRYYYEWSHEVPPMHHPLLALELDLHHNILPPVAHTHVDANALLSRLQPSIWPGWHVLDPLDQVLHSASHLFLDSEARDRLRDLADLDGLFRHFGPQRHGFWMELPARARELGLVEPLALACYFTTRWFETPIPAEAANAIAAAGPARLRRAWLLPLLEKILVPTEPDDSPSFAQELAATILLARYHRQRMPLKFLVPHLWHKMRKPSLDAVTAPDTGNLEDQK